MNDCQWRDRLFSVLQALPEQQHPAFFCERSCFATVKLRAFWECMDTISISLTKSLARLERAGHTVNMRDSPRVVSDQELVMAADNELSRRHLSAARARTARCLPNLLPATRGDGGASRRTSTMLQHSSVDSGTTGRYKCAGAASSSAPRDERR